MPFTAALASLPHGPEFRFVDTLTALDPGRSAVARYTLKGSEPFLAGHFPSSPIMPAVILVEAIAQLAGIAAQTDPANGALPNLRLSAIRNAKIFAAVQPGTEMEISAEITGRLGNLIQASGRVTAERKTIAEAQVVLSGGG